MSEITMWFIIGIFFMIGICALFEGKWGLALYGFGAAMVNVGVIWGLK